MPVRWRSRLAPASLLSVGVVVAVSVSVVAQQSSAGKSAPGIDPDIHKIKHVIVIMQENRSFDSYFGTFPGAAGIPPGVCVPDPSNGSCQRPWVDHNDSNADDPRRGAIPGRRERREDGTDSSPRPRRICARQASRATPT
jgi:hypothetical protein